MVSWAEWKKIYLVGTEWDQYDSVFADVEWDFDYLYNELCNPQSEMFKGCRHVAIFGATEPQMVPFNGKQAVLQIPTLVVVGVEDWLPSMDRVAITSVQMAREEIHPIRRLKMSWTPIDIPGVPASTRQVYYLETHQRKVALKNLGVERLKSFEYCLPYVFNFNREKKEMELADTIVQIQEEIEGRPIICGFDWEMDELDEFVDDLIEENNFNEKMKPAIRDMIRSNVQGAKKKLKEQRETLKSRIASLSDSQRKATENMKLLKFYPQNKQPVLDAVKSAYVNRYYGQAKKVYP